MRWRPLERIHSTPVNQAHEPGSSCLLQALSPPAFGRGDFGAGGCPRRGSLRSGVFSWGLASCPRPCHKSPSSVLACHGHRDASTSSRALQRGWGKPFGLERHYSFPSHQKTHLIPKSLI